MKTKIKILVSVLALFLTIGGIVLASNATKCPVCEHKITLVCPYCGSVNVTHQHYTGTATTETGETIFVNGILATCSTCGFSWSVDI